MYKYFVSYFADRGIAGNMVFDVGSKITSFEALQEVAVFIENDTNLRKGSVIIINYILMGGEE